MTLSTTILWELAAFAAYFVYGSYFEWIFHRHMFHSPKLVYRTFKAHTLVHHQIYKADASYHTHDEHPEKVTMDWWAALAMVAFNLPIFWLIQKVSGIPSIWGGIAMVLVYYTLYESLHWAMHVPAASAFLSRFRVYRFLEEHHRIHHKHMLSNLNVIIPLADYTLGTLRDSAGKRVLPFWHRPKARVAAKRSSRISVPTETRPAKNASIAPIAKTTTTAVE